MKKIEFNIEDEKFLMPIAELISFDASDVITTSGNGFEGEEDDFDLSGL